LGTATSFQWHLSAPHIGCHPSVQQTLPVVLVGLHLDPTQAPSTVTVLVYVDRVETGSPEIISAFVPPEARTLTAADLAVLHGRILAAGFDRLGEARGWSHETLEKIAATHAPGVGTTDAAARFAVTAVGRGASAPEQPHELCVVGAGRPTACHALTNASSIACWTRSATLGFRPGGHARR
jgi:hypothetical protein